MTFRLCIAYDKQHILNLAVKPEKNCKCYRKFSNNFATDCIRNVLV